MQFQWEFYEIYRDILSCLPYGVKTVVLSYHGSSNPMENITKGGEVIDWSYIQRFIAEFGPVESSMSEYNDMESVCSRSDALETRKCRAAPHVEFIEGPCLPDLGSRRARKAGYGRKC